MEGKTLRALIIEKGLALTENYIYLENPNFEDVGNIRLVRI